MILFDSRDTRFKSPVGAVTSGTEVTFNIALPEDLSPTKVGIMMRYDRHDTPAYYEMKAAPRGEGEPSSDAKVAGTSVGDSTALIDYTCSVTINDTGLYWYHFVIDTDNGTLLVGRDQRDNTPLISDEPSEWQQTVYERKYKVPDWIEGGAFYHVFVDRFFKGEMSSASIAEAGRTTSAETNSITGIADSEGQSGTGITNNADQSGVGTSSGSNAEGLPEKVVREDWGGTPEWRPVDGHVYNNDFFGGNLRGVIDKLRYFVDMGITCLYLSPIFEAYSNHKYDTGDYEKIDGMFGSEEDLSELCSRAAALGIRVILDGVFAHTGSDSRYFNKYGNYGEGGAWNDPESPYRSWYFFHDDGTYDSWWDFDTLPKLNKNDPGYTEYITGEDGIIRKWLRAGAAGWRLDVADELPVSFLTSLVSAAKSEKDDSIIIGEVWEDASNKEAYSERKNYFEGERLDSVMNYPFRTGIIDYLRNGNASGLAETVEHILENYPPEVVSCLMNLLGTHDSPRIITALCGKDLGPDPTREEQAETHLSEDEWERGIKLLKAASLLQITLPGVPCIYYGDEAGTEGYKDPFNRTCYPWGHENKDLQEWYRTLLNIRKNHAIFRRGLYRTIAACDGLFAFERYGCGDKPLMPVIIATNMGDSDAEIELPSGSWTDLLDGETYDGNAKLSSGKLVLLELSAI